MKAKKYMAVALSALLLTGCTKDLLDQNPLDALSPSTFYENEDQCKMGLMGVYSTLTPIATPNFWYQLDFMSDNNYCQDSWQGSKEFGEWVHNSSSWAASARWTQNYRTIVKANMLIENLEVAKASEEVKKQMTAEAKFLRAYSYADLITFFGDVPLILKTQTIEESQVARTPKAEVLDQVLKDLDEVAGVLPLKQAGGNVGRATKGAALALKARTLLYNEKWAEAAEAAKKVMDLGEYSLFPSYAGLFEEANENNQEVIFDIQYIKTLQSMPWPTAGTSFTEWPTPNVTVDAIESFYMSNGQPITSPTSGYDEQNPYVNRDPRLAATVVLPGSSYGSILFIPAKDQVPCGARPRKYADIGSSDPGNYSINTIVLRYADILLFRAEALIESGNTGSEVYALIDQVRQRVGMPKVEDVEGSNLSKEQLREVLRHERRVEFMIEGTRYIDMLRWKDESLVHDVYGYNRAKLSDPSSPATWTFEKVKVVTRKFDASKGWLWPIPQDEMQNNANLTQNPGY